ncbi:hypothetical protein K438DRAFT_1847521 [Mycena galopus ATCC 62051]|nr:hypothetical protein K438DRAFT_1847521 [Mycena galopus ATCC 62051]
MVPLAIHGSGVTCMLLERSEDVAKDPTFSARKVGMANLPSYILSQTIKTGTIYVAGQSSEEANQEQANSWFLSDLISGFLKILFCEFFTNTLQVPSN